MIKRMRKEILGQMLMSEGNIIRFVEKKKSINNFKKKFRLELKERNHLKHRNLK